MRKLLIYMFSRPIVSNKIVEKELNISQKNTAKLNNDLIELDKKYKKLLSDSENTDELIRKLEKSKKLDSKLKNKIRPITVKRWLNFERGIMRWSLEPNKLLPGI